MAQAKNLLFVGDVHATPSELPDCQRLLNYVYETARTHRPTVVFLGDQYNTHEVMRVEVLNFWKQNFRKFKDENLNVICLLGNHDYAGPGRMEHAMVAHEEQVVVIDRPLEAAGILFVPYMDDKQAFVGHCKKSSSKTVICHETFAGSRFENGFYAPDGVNPDDIPQKLIISGHIHTPQSFGKVRYVGAPRWRTTADASVESRAIVLMKFENSEPTQELVYETNNVCRRIVPLKDTAESPVSLQFNDLDDYRVDIHGTKEYFLKRKPELSRGNVKVKFVRKDSGFAPIVRESDGIAQALMKFALNFKPKHGTSNDVLQKMCQERLQCLQMTGTA